jgi:cyclomaltodextrinase / maltogenic alpha-amylase / neopullulanase
MSNTRLGAAMIRKMILSLITLSAITAGACGGGGGGSSVDGSTRLSNLTLTGATLSRAFSPDERVYTAFADAAATECALQAFAEHKAQKIYIAGELIDSGAVETISLANAPVTVSILVRAQSGAQNVYSITISRMGGDSDARLAGMTLRSGSESISLIPDFTPDTISYQASVANNVSSITVSPTGINSGTTITVQGSPVISGSDSAPINLTAGAITTITIGTSSADTTSQKTYSIEVNRAGALSNIATLKSLSSSPEGNWDSLFTSTDLTYDTSFPSDTNSITLTPVVTDTGKASVTVNGTSVFSGSASTAISLESGKTRIIPIVVTAEDGSTLKYTVNAFRAGSQNDNADLSGLSLAGITLSPSFTATSLNYTASVASTVSTVTLNAAPAYPGTGITVNGATLSTNHSITLNAAGTSTLATITTLAESGRTKTYTVTINRESDSLMVHFEKPADWSEAWIWFDKGSDGSWDTTALKTAPGDMDNYRAENGLKWYRKDMGKVSTVTFLFNDGTWNRKVTNSGADFVTTKSIWVRQSGSFTYTDPLEQTPPTIAVDPNGGDFAGDQYNVQINIGSSIAVTSRGYTRAINGVTVDTVTMNANTATVNIAAGTKIGDKVQLQVSAANAKGTTNTGIIEFTRVKESTVNDDPDNLRIYQVMVESFINGDDTRNMNTGYGSSHHKGDIQGIINSLDYMKSLGMNAVWMTPIFSMKTSSPSALDATGYFARDYFDVDPHFGTKETLRTLVTEAHKRNMYVILDGVFGHHGGNVSASPNGKYPSGGQDPVSYPGSLDFYKEVAEYWIKNYYIDGWRLDQAYQVAARNQDRNYWKDIREVVEAISNINKTATANPEYSGRKWGTLGYMVGEIWDNETNINTWGYNAEGNTGLRSCFDFPVRYRVVQAFAQEESGKSVAGAANLADGFTTHTKYKAGSHPNLFLTNHDVIRFGDLIKAKYDYYGNNPEYWKRHKAALSFLAAYAGPITLYYGDEIGQAAGNANKGSTWSGILHEARTSGKVDHAAFTNDEKDLHAYTAALMKLRAEHPALWQEGTRTSLSATGQVYADLKYDSATNDRMVYVVNTGTTATSIQLPQSSVGGSLLDGQIGAADVTTAGGNYAISLDSLEAKFFIVK